LSPFSISAYVSDVSKLAKYLGEVSPLNVTYSELQRFLQYLGGTGIAPRSQARIISGIKSFYRYLLFEDLIEDNPSTLLESPRLGRKFPDTLSVSEIDLLLSFIDQSTYENIRNKGQPRRKLRSFLKLSQIFL